MSVVNIQELSEIIGVSRVSITNWIDDGMPYTKAGSKGKPWEFDTEQVIAWWAENKFRPKKRAPAPGADPFAEGGDEPESYEAAERRKMVAGADKAELDLAKTAGRVVMVDDVASVIAELHTRIKTKLLGVGNQVRMHARAYFGEDRAAEEQVVSAVEGVVNDCLSELRDDPFGEGEDEQAST